MTIQTFPIVGAHFRAPAKAILQVLPLGAPLLLRREPSNLYDTNAIAVWVPTSSIPDDQAETLDLLAQGYGFDIGQIMAESEWHVGYVPRVRAEVESPLWDQSGIVERPATMSFNTKGDPRAQMDAEPAAQGTLA